MLIQLLEHPHADIVAVVSRSGSTFNSDFCSLAPLAEAHGIPCFLADGQSQDAMAAWLAPYAPDVIFCLGWSHLLSQKVLGLPNIGNRQAGRLRAASVIDCVPKSAIIADAISNALDSAFRAKAESAIYPFGKPGAAARMLDILATVPLDGVLAKAFHDMDPRGLIAGAAQ